MDNYIYNCFDKTIYDYLNENLNDINISFIKIKDLSIIKNIDSVPFDRTISLMHDLNDLILIFYEKSHELKVKNTNNLTKKIYLRENKNKKTIKKQYKD